MSEITDELFTAAVTAYYSRRFGFRADDKEFLLLMLDNDMHDDDLRAALAVAFAAGRESAYEGGGERWHVTFKGSYYSQPQVYATEVTCADAMEAAADAEHHGHQEVKVRMRRLSAWADVPREVAR